MFQIISMEKLIKLLNEYTKQSYDDYSFFKYIEPTHSFYISDDGYESYIPEETILSKRFGFISWLVDNDKIDLDKVKENWIKRNGKMDIDGLYRYSVYERVLMLLAISDTPIEDLLLYLK